MPDMAAYAALNADCAVKTAAGDAFGADRSDGDRSSGGACVDDADGSLARVGVSCTMLVSVRRIPCGFGLGSAGWAVPAGATWS